MITNDINDTIAAISTPIGESGIGIVRLSGKDALNVADKIFISKDHEKPSDFKTYTTHYGWIMEEPKAKSQKPKGKPGEFVDEVILTVMRSPRSYTKEDIVEINCHGGILPLRRTLDLVLNNGCRLAGPGEFTQRAFLNGRIDLAQAEAVLDIIRAKTDSALKVGMEQLKGAVSNEINKLRGMLLEILSTLEADIDFSEEETGLDYLRGVSKKMKNINAKLMGLLDTSRQGRIFREGIHTVICGKPNVGKSSLLNALVKQERSLVTSVAGTTRDTIEEIIDIKGIPVRIVDTAGIIEPRDLVEKKAVLRSKRYIQLADLIILVLDGSRRLTQEDAVLMEKIKGKQTIAVINKIDLKQRIGRGTITKRFFPTVRISAKKSRNINLLEDAIASLVYEGKINSSEPAIISNLRHIEALNAAQKLVAQAVHSLDNKLPLEFIAQDLKDALAHLDSLLGKKFSEDLLDKIFSEFCIGK